MCNETPGHMCPPGRVRCESSAVVDMLLVVCGIFFDKLVESCFSRDGNVHLGARVAAAEVVGGVGVVCLPLILDD